MNNNYYQVIDGTTMYYPEYVEKLQQENRELKQQLYSPDLTITTCPRCGKKYSINYSREIYELREEHKRLVKEILNETTVNITLKKDRDYWQSIIKEFEKWLENAKEDIAFPEDGSGYGHAQNVGYCFALKDCKDKLRKLKEGNK